jgi:CDGSH-type Zn-finger protein/uncharacterized Fe-S cluster protein YjdI
MVDEIRGKRALIRFDGDKCIHSRNCVLSRPDVFVPNVDGEWIHPDAAAPEEIAGLALNCPSGAIAYERLDGGEGEKPPLVNAVHVRENGPYAVHAEMAIEGHGAQLRATLCRCGDSKNKPFCDGTHSKAGFEATGEPKTQESAQLDKRNGPLTVKPAKNGPLLVEGNLEICAGTGRTVKRVTKAALCRCGHSANKPFCDGTHTKIGFQAD